MVRIPTIPEFANGPEEVAAALRAIKDAVEQLGGLRQGESKGAPQIFVQASPPTQTRRLAYKTGDLWVNTSTNKMNYWSGTAWVELT